MAAAILLMCTAAILNGADGHGMLWEPPGRSTMWRRGFKTPMNPNDNELNCGGFEVLYILILCRISGRYISTFTVKIKTQNVDTEYRIQNTEALFSVEYM